MNRIADAYRSTAREYERCARLVADSPALGLSAAKLAEGAREYAALADLIERNYPRKLEG